MRLSRFRKKIAIGLLLLTIFNLVLPMTGHALTSGPVQPETTAFRPAGASDMVDLFSGEFKYNIPLLDIDGYPINLNYASGSGMDDEASWVGLGWNVNVGAINRQVRGIPDDMSGDAVETDHFTKPKVTVGGRLGGRIEIFGNGKTTHSDNLPSVVPSGSLSVGIFNDSYTGIGADIGANAGVSFGKYTSSPYTASLGLGLTSSTTSGVDVTPSANLGIRETMYDKIHVNAGLSASLGYNTRSGLKGFTLGSSFDPSYLHERERQGQPNELNPDGTLYGNDSYGTRHHASGTMITFNTQPILPTIQIPYRTRAGSFSAEIGGAFNGFSLAGMLTGYRNVSEVASAQPGQPAQLFNPAYGFLYAERGKNQKQAVMDFIRENDNPVIPELPAIAVPVPTPDLFSFTSQEGSGQFRLYRGGSGVFFDNEVSDDDGSNTIGADVGFGPSGFGLDHGGITWFKQNGKNTTRKWTGDNAYLTQGDFQDADYIQPANQHAYFKVVGEKTQEDAAMVTQLYGTQPLAVSITGAKANAGYTNNLQMGGPLKKTHRAMNKTQISYLTAEEAAAGGLETSINAYPINDVSNFTLPANNKPVPAQVLPRWGDAYHQKHHISEITVTNGGGKRMVYGLPVYNVTHKEFSFAIGSKLRHYGLQSGTNNIVPVTATGTTFDHSKGIDQYYHMRTQPAYASSFLLTAILSPDYADRTGDGISDDDPGTAIKFNYSKLPALYKWRTPYSGGTINRALLADQDDDKASVVYGEKEVWYISSIESKTKVAYFITQSRDDARGVVDFTGNGMDTSNPLKCLKEIRLYSKADMSKPIKVVKFEYDYELCRGVPNTIETANAAGTTGGKLTLKKVWFQYGNSPKGANFPYQFAYKDSVSSVQANYGDMMTDRWGTYKSNANLGGLTNDEFPYTAQDFQGNQASVKQTADENAAVWQLTSITLPTGGTINMTYEANDYAYVQNKRAMVMTGIDGLVRGDGTVLPDPGSATYLKDAKGIALTIPKIPPTPLSGDQLLTWFKENYLDGQDYMYTKFLTKVSTSNSLNAGPDYDYDFVSCYAKVQQVMLSGNSATVIFEDRNDGNVQANPIIFSAWQKMKDEYPRYAYPGFDQRAGDAAKSSALVDAIKAILAANGNLSELLENFYHKAARKNYACSVQLSKCFVRLTKQDGFKLGGGARVKKIIINDTWNKMTTADVSRRAIYGQAYDYTTMDNGVRISSGVASYEPAVGNDENALKQPVPYVEHIKGAVDDYFDLEEPFGESFFPAPGVGYSKVTVTDLDKTQKPDPALRTGYTVSEYYTAKDFPVQVATLPLTKNVVRPAGNKFSFLGATYVDELILAQGFSLVTNDMHGKLKATRVFNQSGAEVSSTVYYYNATPTGADTYQLNNAVTVVNPDGSVSAGQVLGRDIDFFTDFREFESKNTGRSYDAGFDDIGWLAISFPFPYFPNYDNSDYKLFRSAAAVKVSQYYGIIDRVVKTENGSTITTQNLAFDGLTGEPVVTQTQTEFNKYIYTTDIPAYWVYQGMGGAYQNAGILLKNFATDGNGVITGSYLSYLKAGDEILDLSGARYWVIQDQATSPSTETAPTKKLVDITGGYKGPYTPPLVKLVRSGYRNLLDAATERIVSLNNPIVGNRLQLTQNSDQTSLKVINAATTLYNESWAMDQNGQSQDYTKVPTGVASTYQSAPSGFVYGITQETPFPYPTYFPENQFQSDQVTFSKVGIIRSCIWPTAASGLLSNPKIDIEQSISTNDGNFFFVYSGSGNYQYTIDHSINLPVPSTGFGLYELHLSSGIHTLSLVAPNNGGSSQFIGMMVFNPTGDGHLGTVLFSTENLANQNDIHTYDYRYHINPYVRGFLGNWREVGTSVFQQSRHYNTDPSVKGVNVSNAGYINQFSSYWYYDVLPSSVPVNTVTFGQTVSLPSRGSSGVYYFAGDIPGAQDQVLTSGSLVSRMQGALDRSGIWPVPVTAQQLGHQVTAVGTFTSGAGEYYFGYSGDDNYVYSVDGTTLPQRPNTLWCWYPMTLAAGTHHLTLQATNNNSSFPGAIGMEVYQNADGSGTPVFSTTSLIGIAAPPPQYAWQTDNLGNRARWVTANTITGYDRYGQQIENKDALGRYSAALFGFNGELPVAVASNTNNREIYAAAFEDTQFSPGTGFNKLRANDFVVTNTNSLGTSVVNSDSHSGRYCVALPSAGLTLMTKAYNKVSPTSSLLTINQYGEYNTRTGTDVQGLYPNGFEPKLSQYIIDVWVKDGHPTDKVAYLQLNAGVPQTAVDNQYSPTSVSQVPLTVKAVVEDWKLMEGTVDLSQVGEGQNYAISLTPGANATQQLYVDDIRIFPVNSQMKTFVYDDRNMRLMAELDENGFATFYEYDDEGLLIRVKKETERGVMTLKESRSSYLKNVSNAK